MPIGIRLENIEFSSGEEVAPPTEGVLLIVGPNNVGKSRALREIVQHLTNHPHHAAPTLAVSAVTVAKNGDTTEFEEWLNHHARRREPTPANPQVRFTRPGLGTVAWSELEAAWSHAPPLGRAAPMFITYLAPGDRLNLMTSVALWDTMQEDPQHPIQLLYDTPALEVQLRSAAIEAFGVPLFVNRYAGTQIHVQLGDPPTPVPPPAPQDLVETLRALPHAYEQGDGLRSFMGILLTLIAGVQRILVVDEPEAFLHPPQARLLGRKLAEVVPEGRQVIAATHNADVVIGALDALDAKVTIVRLTRDADVNRIAVLPHEQLRELWSDPLLRFSNVLDGLFHRAVVVCEADGDSMFFAAAFDHWLRTKGLPASEVLFTHSAGKSRLHRVADALRAVDVPVRIIADVDILNDSTDVERILRALGADPSPVVDLQSSINADISGGAPNPRKEFVEDRLADIFRESPVGEPLSDRAIREAKALLRSTRGWNAVKQSGLSALNGDTLVRAQGAIEQSRAAGLLILDGELEAFDRTIPHHGPDWVGEALTKGVHKSDATQRFIAELAASLGMALR